MKLDSCVIARLDVCEFVRLDVCEFVRVGFDFECEFVNFYELLFNYLFYLFNTCAILLSLHFKNFLF